MTALRGLDGSRECQGSRLTILMNPQRKHEWKIQSITQSKPQPPKKSRHKLNGVPSSFRTFPTAKSATGLKHQAIVIRHDVSAVGRGLKVRNNQRPLETLLESSPNDPQSKRESPRDCIQQTKQFCVILPLTFDWSEPNRTNDEFTVTRYTQADCKLTIRDLRCPLCQHSSSSWN